MKCVGPVLPNKELKEMKTVSNVSAIPISLSEVAPAVERFGEKKFWFKALFPSLVQNFLPFSSIIRHPQTPQTTLRNGKTAGTVFGIKAENTSPQSVIDQVDRKRIFQLVFLHDDVDQSVDVKEVDEIDFGEVKTRVENGDSVFITMKENEKIDIGPFEAEVCKETSQKL